MKYRNKRTGKVIETYGKIAGPDYEEVKTEKATPKKAKVKEKADE